MGDFQPGARVRARDRENQWYEARIMRHRGEGDQAQALVHFTGWPASQDEWHNLVGESMSQRSLEDITLELYGGSRTGHAGGDTFFVSRILGSRLKRGGTEYFVEWEGDEWLGQESWTTNEDGALDELVAEYNAQRQDAAEGVVYPAYAPLQPSPLAASLAVSMVLEYRCLLYTSPSPRDS